MASLTGTKIKDTYDSLLKVSDNGALDGTLQTITDGLGNDSALSLSTAGASVGGTLAVSGNLAVDTNTLFVDASNNRVGIGTTSILGDFSINNASEMSAYFFVAGTRYAGLYTDGSIFSVNTYNSAELTFSTSTGTSFAERMRLATSGDISFRDSSANEAFYWDASAASLGIGTTSPATKLDIRSTTSNYQLRLGFDSSFYYDIGRSAVDGLFYFYGGQSGANGYVFGGVNGERMRIDSSGNVGIGTSSLNLGGWSKALCINGAVSEALELHTNGTHFLSLAAGGSSTLLYAVANVPLVFGTNNTERMRITSGGYLKASDNGTYLSATGAYHELRNNASDNWTIDVGNTSASPYGISVRYPSSTPNNTSNFFFVCADTTTDRLRIMSNGNVVNSNNSYGALSDAKLKENVVDASPKLEDLMQVQVRNFNYIGDDKKQLGVVAQELEEVFPSMIDESPDFEEVEVPQLDENGQEVLDENGEVVMTKERVDLGTVTKSVKYSVFVPMLIKAMQEQQKIINDLKARIEQLEA